MKDLYINITTMSDTELVDLLNAVTCEVNHREQVEGANRKLLRLFQYLESHHLDLVDQETGEVLEYGRVLVN